MIVICSGMARSGSTWSFNVMKTILQGAGLKLFSGAVGEHKSLDDFISQNLSKDQSMLLKSHHPGPGAMALISKGLAKSVRTYRDPRDCLASRVSFQSIPFEEAMNLVLAEQKIHDALISSGKTLLIRYEDMMENTGPEIQKIGAYLGANLEPQHIDFIDEQTNIESSKKKVEQLQRQPETNSVEGRKLDNNSLLQSNHISGGIIGRWRSDFSAREQEIIAEKLTPWAVELGYSES